MAKYFFDRTLAAIGLCVSLPLSICIAVSIKATSSGPILFWSKRVGKDSKIFRMAKFRSMAVDTPNIATHDFADPQVYFTKIGRLLRNTSLDEIPQLWSIFIGDMSFVGPRPGLPSQTYLIAARQRLGIDCLLPGLTGWAQINGRDITDQHKVMFDEAYLQRQSFWFDIKIIALTIIKVIRKDGVSH